MPENSNTSFIPKRNPTKTGRNNSPRPVFIGLLVVRVIFFAVLIASIGVFAYEKKLKSDLDFEIQNLNSVISTFNEDDLDEIVSIDNRLNQIKYRLAHTASITSIFGAIEAATLGTVEIDDLKLKRLDDTLFSIESKMKTDSFDSVLFQRGQLERNDKLVVTAISDVILQNEVETTDRAGVKVPTSEKTVILFNAELAVNTDLIPHVPLSEPSPIETLPVSESSQIAPDAETSDSGPASSTESRSNNQEGI